MEYIKSSKIYFDDGIKDGYLVVSNGKIVGFLDKTAQVEKYEDYQDNRVLAGIIDTHNHGTYGYDLDVKGTEEEIKKVVRGYTKGLAYDGVTACFPTSSDIIKEIADVSLENELYGARILGVHSEGPYFNRVGEGGRNFEYPGIDLKVIQKMIDDGQGQLKLVAMAPELENYDEAIQLLLDHGVRVAYAHSNLKSKGAREAIDKGVTVATHTSNVMVGLHHRDIGGLGALLSDDRVMCEVICDGLHVCLDFIELMFKIKDKSKFMMISDCTAFCGIKPGRYEVGWVTPINVTEEGFVKDDDGRLMGSSKPVIYGIKNLVETCGIPLEEVSKMASLNPAIHYGYADTKGSITIGKDADVMVIDDNYEVLATYVEGIKVFDSKVEEKTFNSDYDV